jgi:1,4-alpha-glucan branching enzyme
MPASPYPDVGVLPLPGGGASFRVWAPFARSVAATGTFNSWSATADPLTAEGNGYWSGIVPSAAVGHQYKFVLHGPHDEELWRIDPYAREVTNSRGNGVIANTDYAWTTPDYRMPRWDELIIYELHIGSFQLDPASPIGRGTFDSVIARLDYLRDLGITAIQVMAAQEFATDVSWGYNPAHIFAIESAYGGPNGFRRFVDAAHGHGLAVILDVVYNHFGPSDLDLWQFDGWSENGKGGIYFYNDWRSTTPWGDTRPDYGRSEVRRFLTENALRWLESRHCDGLRWDATNYIRNVGGNGDPGADVPAGWGLMQAINGEIKRRQPWKLTIAEDMQDDEWLTRSEREGGAGFGAQWGARFLHTVRRALAAPDDGGRDVGALATVLGQRYNGDALQRVVYTESHDEVAGANGKVRVPEEIWPGNAESWAAQKRSTLGAALVFTAPGIPMLFMGQEFLQYGAWGDQAPLDWALLDRHQGIHSLYRDLIRLRRNWYDTTRGLKGSHVNVYHVNPADKLLAFHRWSEGGPGDDVVVLVNLGSHAWPAYTIGLPRGGTWRVRFNSDWAGYSAAFGGFPSDDRAARPEPYDGLPYRGELSIGPYTAVILSQDRA